MIFARSLHSWPIELVDRALQQIAVFVMLHDHHRDVV